MTASREHDLIARYFAPLAGPEGLGLLDDAALLTPMPGHEWVVTADALVAGVHFFAHDPAGQIAAKALRVNLSDLAAKAATPRGFTLSLALPHDTPARWIKAFAKGLGDDMARYGIKLIGGDTVATPGPLCIALTAFGEVATGQMVKRSTARAGDAIYITGTIGDSALGLKCLMKTISPRLAAHHRRYLVSRYRLPEPRLALRGALEAFASAAMDVSDGLVGDLAKLLAATGRGGAMLLDAIPLSPAAQAAVALDASAFATALTGGDDYEILATVPKEACKAFEQASAAANVRVTQIGVVRARVGVVWRDGDGHKVTFSSSAYSHF